MEKTDPKTAALMASRRKLSDDDHDGHDHGGEHETEIVAIGFFASAEAAAEAADETPTDTAVFESNEAFTGLEVTDVSTTSTEAVELPFTIIIGVGAGLVVVTILLALNASCWAKKKAEGAKGAPPSLPHRAKGEFPPARARAPRLPGPSTAPANASA